MFFCTYFHLHAQLVLYINFVFDCPRASEIKIQIMYKQTTLVFGSPGYSKYCAFLECTTSVTNHQFVCIYLDVVFIMYLYCVASD